MGAHFLALIAMIMTVAHLHKKGLINANWRGDLPLYKSFWLFGVAPILIISLFRQLFYTGAGLLFFLIIFPVYLVWATVGIWRSSTRYRCAGGHVVFSVLAKAVTVIFVLINIIGLVPMFM